MPELGPLRELPIGSGDAPLCGSSSTSLKGLPAASGLRATYGGTGRTCVAWMPLIGKDFRI